MRRNLEQLTPLDNESSVGSSKVITVVDADEVSLSLTFAPNTT